MVQAQAPESPGNTLSVPASEQSSDTTQKKKKKKKKNRRSKKHAGVTRQRSLGPILRPLTGGLSLPTPVHLRTYVRDENTLKLTYDIDLKENLDGIPANFEKQVVQKETLYGKMTFEKITLVLEQSDEDPSVPVLVVGWLYDEKAVASDLDTAKLRNMENIVTYERPFQVRNPHGKIGLLTQLRGGKEKIEWLDLENLSP